MFQKETAILKKFRIKIEKIHRNRSLEMFFPPTCLNVFFNKNYTFKKILCIRLNI